MISCKVVIPREQDEGESHSGASHLGTSLPKRVLSSTIVAVCW